MFGRREMTKYLLYILKKYFKSQYCGFFLDWLVVTRADEIDLAGDCP